MVNKKYLLLAGFCSLMAAQPVIAQESESATASWSGRDIPIAVRATMSWIRVITPKGDWFNTEGI